MSKNKGEKFTLKNRDKFMRAKKAIMTPDLIKRNEEKGNVPAELTAADNVKKRFPNMDKEGQILEVYKLLGGRVDEDSRTHLRGGSKAKKKDKFGNDVIFEKKSGKEKEVI